VMYALLNRAHRFVIPGTIVVGVAFILVVGVWNNPDATQGKWSGENFDTTVSIRLEQMESFMSLFRTHPLLGIGLGGYDPDYARFSEDTSRPYLQELEYHNLLAKLGVTGMLCLMSAFVCLFYECWRRIKANPSMRTRGLIAGLAAGLLGMLVASATNPLYSSIYFHLRFRRLLMERIATRGSRGPDAADLAPQP
jgi:O-antigen ligase